MLRRPTILAAIFPLLTSIAAQDTPAPARSIGSDVVTTLGWRNIGPANMGGRVTDIAVHPDGMRRAWYLGTAGGGVFKSTNAGTTWTSLFDDQAVASIGDVAIAPGDPDTIWVGTGEENGRNSVAWGDGVYKSTDAGETFAHMGLAETFQIGHVAIHPHDADVVFVAALGRLWSHCPNRGVFRTRDGGATWQRVLFLDDATGCIDVRCDPEDPNTIYACMYERMRDAFDANDPVVRFGDAAGLFKSTDGGDSWRRLTDGLPTCAWGRSGLAIHADNPAILYLTVETERSGWFSGVDEDDPDATPEGDALMGVQGDPDEARGGIVLRNVTRGGAATKAGLAVGDLVLALGSRVVQTREEFVGAIRSKGAGDEVRVRYRRGEDDTELEAQLIYGKRPAPRRPPNGPFGTRLGGQRANKQSEQGQAAFETGGVFRSDDHGEHWHRVNSLADRPFYYSVIAVHPHEPKDVYSCGVPFYASFDGGETFDSVHDRIHVDFHAIALDPEDQDHVLVGCDGGLYESLDRCKTWRHIDNLMIGQFYHVGVDQSVPYQVYGGLQDNGSWGGPSRSRYRDGLRRADWMTISGGDGFRTRVDPTDPSTVFATSQNGGVSRIQVDGARRGRVNKPADTRWNWDTPFFLSPHNSGVLYLAGNRVCRSLDGGRNTEVISGDLELGLTDRGTATAFAESPRIAGRFYVGTDDGALWRSTDSGHTWEELHTNLLGLPGPRYVSHIEPSHYAEGRVYVTFDGHRSDDRAPHAYVSEDSGDTWTAMSDRPGFPDAPCHVIREFPAAGTEADPGNPELLLVGTEYGCVASLDRGAHWEPLGTDLPTVAVRDLAIQKRDTDLIAATHGRGLFVLDLAPLLQLAAEPDTAIAHLFRPEDARLWKLRARPGQGGHANWQASNPAYGARLHLWLGEAPGEDAKLMIHGIEGAAIRAIPLEDRAGHHVLHWNARRGGKPKDDDPPGAALLRTGSRVGPGVYSVRLTLGEASWIQPLRLLPDPGGLR